MEKEDLKTMDGTMIYIVATFFTSMARMYHSKLNKKEDECKDELGLVNRFINSLNNIDEHYSEFIKREYLINFENKWWFLYFDENEYKSLKTKSLKAFFKEFACEL